MANKTSKRVSSSKMLKYLTLDSHFGLEVGQLADFKVDHASGLQRQMGLNTVVLPTGNIRRWSSTSLPVPEFDHTFENVWQNFDVLGGSQLVGLPGQDRDSISIWDPLQLTDIYKEIMLAIESGSDGRRYWKETTRIDMQVYHFNPENTAIAIRNPLSGIVTYAALRTSRITGVFLKNDRKFVATVCLGYALESPILEPENTQPKLLFLGIGGVYKNSIVIDILKDRGKILRA